MHPETVSFLDAQRISANNPLGSHVARSRGLAIALSRANPAKAQSIANDIDSDLERASNMSGFHPESCHRLAVWLRDWKKAL